MNSSNSSTCRALPICRSLMKKRARGSNLPVNQENKSITQETASASDGKIRLQLYMARAGVASRRASEAIITDGRGTVNGTVVTALGTKVSDADSVCVEGKEIHAEEAKRYVLLNKDRKS